MTDEWLDVQRALSKLPIVLKERVVTGATGAAARVIRDEAKNRVPVKTGTLKKAIIAKKARKNNQPKEGIRYLVVPKTTLKVKSNILLSVGGNQVKGKVVSKYHTFYGRFLEDGTKNMAAKPYLLPAAKAKKDEAVKAFQDYAIIRTEKEVRKMAR